MPPLPSCRTVDAQHGREVHSGHEYDERREEGGDKCDEEALLQCVCVRERERVCVGGGYDPPSENYTHTAVCVCVLYPYCTHTRTHLRCDDLLVCRLVHGGHALVGWDEVVIRLQPRAGV